MLKRVGNLVQYFLFYTSMVLHKEIRNLECGHKVLKTGLSKEVTILYLKRCNCRSTYFRKFSGSIQAFLGTGRSTVYQNTPYLKVTELI